MSHKQQSTEYDKDFYAWSMHNASLLRQGKLSEVDIAHIAEEIESMGRADKRELVSRLAVLLAHLLKWKFQPSLQGKSWKVTIKEQRREVTDLLSESPSLKHELDDRFSHAYQRALDIIEKETELNLDTLPKICPFSLMEALDESFFPE
jgi:Domain of unknown function DUF29